MAETRFSFRLGQSDTAQFVAHENTARHLGMPPSGTPLPEGNASWDVNGNGRIERSEARGGVQNSFELYDADRDGVLNGAEITRGPLADVRAPDITYSNRKTITLGGKRVEMIHVPIEHADDNSVILFPDDDTVFVVDFVLVNRLPFGALVGEIDEAAEIEALDFEHFVPGHGQVGTRADMAAHRRYREDLREAVAEGVAAGALSRSSSAASRSTLTANGNSTSNGGPTTSLACTRY